MADKPTKWTQVWDTIKNVSWYKWTVFQDSGGDVTRWIDATNTNLKVCKGIVRRSDGLIFQNTLYCRECVKDEPERYNNRGYQVGYYFRGQDTFGISYDILGRHLPNKKN